jgi:hypothetical protein
MNTASSGPTSTTCGQNAIFPSSTRSRSSRLFTRAEVQMLAVGRLFWKGGNDYDKLAHRMDLALKCVL